MNKPINRVRDSDELCEMFRPINNQEILSTVWKIHENVFDMSLWDKKIMVSISGGSDSDIVLDLFERIGYKPGQVAYVWFDTGLEYEATKRHLVYLEEKYGIEIQRHKAKVPIPLAVKKYGVPFMSKQISEFIGRLQKHGFGFASGCGPLEYLESLYDGCRSALLWWCNRKKSKKCCIGANAGLKEFLMLEPPQFYISGDCCKYAKKNVSVELEKSTDAELLVSGERQAEGGVRAQVYKSCYTPAGKRIAKFRPIFFWTDADKKEYEDFCGIVHSDCYTVYGMKRTGCAGCPFNSRFEEDLKAIEKYEPKLYKAACNIFGESYEYTRKYRKFKESWKREKRRGGQIDLFDNWEDLI